MVAAVDVLAHAHALDGDEELLLVLVPDKIGTETVVVVVVDLYQFVSAPE